ncbi:nitrilase-related carbon-nitrogen hydrolase [Candidatus Nitronereus thalassa]|uniref:Acyltransferase n=1 Tax=Candidatus Nitronereus thalassa TaxID=3020898 RepID=A0ABU3KAT2_9BACT|nr:nitrilase-related carbon-nitrogen hydrolase [Candidatus Nitronereus thalassa]MDT7043516.1 acyltransferase [Candidatus Nitronereus thalassa]
MKVGYFQSHPLFGEVEKNIEGFGVRLTSVECDLLVLPELAFSGYQFVSQEEVLKLSEPVPEGFTTQTCIELARKHNMHLVVGLPERDGDRCYNSAIIVGPSGYVGCYRKTHLFFEETLFFTPGNSGFQVWDIGQACIGVMICFDWYYPEAARTLALKGADILCHPSNLVLPHCPDAMVTRSLENRIFSITANRIGREARGEGRPLTFIGKSEVVSPKGKILHRAPIDQEELITVDIALLEARDKSINPYNDLLKDRRPEMYS